MIFYRPIYNQATEPATPNKGDMWILAISSITYQLFIYLNNQWRILLGGGNYIAETDPDIHYYNIIFDTAIPSTITTQTGWFWFNETSNELFIYNGNTFISLLAITV
jgi:hypothetical protein